MTRALLEAVRDRLTVRNALTAVAVFGGLHFVLGVSRAQLATSMAMGLVVGLADVVTDVYDLRNSVKHLATGLPAVVGGLVLLAFDDGPVWVPVAILLVGGWFVLDAVQTVRHEGATKPARTGREVYRSYVARRVHETLADGPLTRRELGDELDADPADVDRAVERLVDRGVLERAGSELREAPDPESDGLARVGEWIRRFAGRVARPVALEFGRAGDGTDAGDGTVGSGHGSVDSRHSSDGDSSIADVNDEPEVESESASNA